MLSPNGENQNTLLPPSGENQKLSPGRDNQRPVLPPSIGNSRLSPGGENSRTIVSPRGGVSGQRSRPGLSLSDDLSSCDEVKVPLHR